MISSSLSLFQVFTAHLGYSIVLPVDNCASSFLFFLAWHFLTYTHWFCLALYVAWKASWLSALSSGSSTSGSSILYCKMKGKGRHAKEAIQRGNIETYVLYTVLKIENTLNSDLKSHNVVLFILKKDI